MGRSSGYGQAYQVHHKRESMKDGTAELLWLENSLSKLLLKLFKTERKNLMKIIAYKWKGIQT